MFFFTSIRKSDNYDSFTLLLTFTVLVYVWRSCVSSHHFSFFMGYLDISILCCKESNSMLLYIDQSCPTGFLFTSHKDLVTMHRWRKEILSFKHSLKVLWFTFFPSSSNYHSASAINYIFELQMEWNFFLTLEITYLLRPMKIFASQVFIYKILKFRL